MSYKDFLRQRIQELQHNIDNNVGQVDALKKELKELELKEFEEDLRESQESPQILLKG